MAAEKRANRAFPRSRGGALDDARRSARHDAAEPAAAARRSGGENLLPCVCRGAGPSAGWWRGASVRPSACHLPSKSRGGELKLELPDDDGLAVTAKDHPLAFESAI